MDLADPIEPATDVRVAVHPHDLGQHRLVSDRPRRARPLLVRVVAVRGDLDPVLTQHAADRLDPEPVPVVVNEGDYHGKRGSSSRAKNEEAANKISLARFSSRTS